MAKRTNKKAQKQKGFKLYDARVSKEIKTIMREAIDNGALRLRRANGQFMRVSDARRLVSRMSKAQTIYSTQYDAVTSILQRKTKSRSTNMDVLLSRLDVESKGRIHFKFNLYTVRPGVDLVIRHEGQKVVASTVPEYNFQKSAGKVGLKFDKRYVRVRIGFDIGAKVPTFFGTAFMAKQTRDSDDLGKQIIAQITMALNARTIYTSERYPWVEAVLRLRRLPIVVIQYEQVKDEK
ncbi:MAG: hypothetical protein KCHDKBKB_02980 [Elusimicrobia bacterium]|nr:hypothetical protein [Elusimicrobiota bacterium]